MSGTKELSERIEKTKKKKEQYQARLQLLEKRLSQKQKKEDTRKKILAGAFLLKAIEDGRAVSLSSEAELKEELEKFLTRNSDRVLFGLPEIEEKSDKSKK